MGQAVALNNLSVNHMLLASPPSDAGSLKGVDMSNNATLVHINKAISMNAKHVEIADGGGKFVAHTNLGLSYGMAGDIEKASKHHQDALRIAIKMQTLYGQSIAVGNLGLIALTKSDYLTAKTCFEQVYCVCYMYFVMIYVLFCDCVDMTCTHNIPYSHVAFIIFYILYII